MDYKNGKIYRLVLDDTNEEYIGSTTQPLSKRFNSHKSNFYRRQNGDKKVSNYSCFSLFEKGTPQIFLLEDFPCESKRHLEKREREVLEQRRRDGIVCVNKALPTRSAKEYGDFYYSTHRTCDEFMKKNRAKALNYYHNNTEQVLEKMKKYRETNKGVIRERKNKKIVCDNCGVESSSSHISRHKKSKKCQNFKK